MYKINIENYYRLQEEHKDNWRTIQWLEKAHDQARLKNPLDLIYVEEEEQLKNEYMSKKRFYNAAKYAHDYEHVE